MTLALPTDILLEGRSLVLLRGKEGKNHKDFPLGSSTLPAARLSNDDPINFNDFGQTSRHILKQPTTARLFHSADRFSSAQARNVLAVDSSCRPRDPLSGKTPVMAPGARDNTRQRKIGKTPPLSSGTCPA